MVNFLFAMMALKISVYQLTLDMSELKKDKGTDYILSWKSKKSMKSLRLKLKI